MHLGHRLGQLGLAGAGRALDEDRLAEPVGEVDDAGDAVVGQVVDLLQAVTDLVDGLEPMLPCDRHPTGRLDQGVNWSSGPLARRSARPERRR